MAALAPCKTCDDASMKSARAMRAGAGERPQMWIASCHLGFNRSA
jgi:hypothetical protein